MTVVHWNEFTEGDWAQVGPRLSGQERGGKRKDHRTVKNGMVWVLRSRAGEIGGKLERLRTGPVPSGGGLEPA